MRIIKKFIVDFLLSNLDDVEISGPDIEQVLYYDASASKWKNGDTSKVLLMTPQLLERKLFAPAGKNSFIGEFDSNGFEVEIEGELQIL